MQAIQSMGNLGLQIGSGKEQWMEPLHPLIIESVQQIKKFIDEVVDVEMNNGGKSMRFTWNY
jgi:RAS protein activator-like 1